MNTKPLWHIALTNEGQFLFATKTEPQGTDIGKWVYHVQADTKAEAVTLAKARFAKGESSDTIHANRA